jgi:hypothetical protein
MPPMKEAQVEVAEDLPSYFQDIQVQQHSTQEPQS